MGEPDHPATPTDIGDAHDADGFIAQVSHDLRGSVLSIIGFSDLVLEALPADLDPATRSHVERISANAQHLQRQLEDLSELAGIRVGAADDLHPVPLHEVLAAVALEARHHQPQLRVSIGALPAVRLDHKLASQLFTEILANAVNHGGRADLHVVVGAEVHPGSDATVEVADDGQGIPDAERRRVLEPFFRLNGQPAGEAGTGMGLTICRRIMEAAGGEITIGASASGGALVRLTFPAQRIAHQTDGDR